MISSTARRNRNLGWYIPQIVTYVKIFVLIKTCLRFVWSHKRGFPTRAACKCMLTSKNFPRICSFLLVSANFIRIRFVVKTKGNMHLANTAHIVHFLCYSLKFLRHLKFTYIKFQFCFCCQGDRLILCVVF